MTTLFFFLGGVTLSLATDKLYHLFVSDKHSPEESEASAREDGIPSDGEEGHDDLSQLKGVGPKLASALDEVGIYSYAQLSGASADTLFEQLKEAGGKFNRVLISSVVEQAQLSINKS